MKMRLLHVLSSYLFIMLLSISCSMFGDLFEHTFTTDAREISFTVNPSEAGNYTFVEKVLQSDIKEIEENGGKIADLESIKLKEAVLEVITSGKNLDPLNSVEVYLSSVNHPEVLVASASTIADGSVSVDLVLTPQELKDYLSDEEYTVRIEGSLGEDITETIEMKLKIRFEVTVG